MTLFYDFRFSQIRHQLPKLFCTTLHIFYCINLYPSQSMDPTGVTLSHTECETPYSRTLRILWICWRMKLVARWESKEVFWLSVLLTCVRFFLNLKDWMNYFGGLQTYLPHCSWTQEIEYYLPFTYVRNMGTIFSASIFVISRFSFILKACGSAYKIHTECVNFISAVKILAHVTISSSGIFCLVSLAQSLLMHNLFSNSRPEFSFKKYKSEYASFLHKTLYGFSVPWIKSPPNYALLNPVWSRFC